MPVWYGMCISKNFLITPNWKCVDFRQPSNLTIEKQREIAEVCRKTDWFDVCPMCRYYKDGKLLTEADLEATRPKVVKS
jgi:hypothetical protein